MIRYGTINGNSSLQAIDSTVGAGKQFLLTAWTQGGGTISTDDSTTVPCPTTPTAFGIVDLSKVKINAAGGTQAYWFADPV